MSSKDITMACQVTRSFANRACLDALGRQLQPSRDTGELTAQMQRLWQDLPQGSIESMPRRISACIARWLYYLLIFNLLQAVTA
ncbi:hypothetical protein TNCV_4706301 [Trichonephila clavipes]|nr:hypothetical protein TNCV_4706301 [Trichonephila clavipes]